MTRTPVLDAAPPAPSTRAPAPARIPRDAADDYDPAVVERRRAFAEALTGVRLTHLRAGSFDPHVVRGNCEHFTGVAQVPVGLAGPLLVDGEHARGRYLIPLATTEGTLVASYNRGMHALNRAGGVRATVVADAMQRAPVFVLPDARAARELAEWVMRHETGIRRAAESTSRVAELLHIERYQSNHLLFLRLDFATGDAAGQNMVTRATAAACAWIVATYPGPIVRWHLESNLASDKKTSWINMLQTRGKRVTAEATIPRAVLVDRLHVRPESLIDHYKAAGIGAFIAATSNNGLHAANALAALFIATGQDAANVAESSAAIVFADLVDGDLYLSVTLPSLIVATHGGGTGLPTQRECLQLLGCAGPGRVRAFAEIVAAVVLAGEVSLAAAISAHEWVEAHERLGRNR